MVSGHGRQDVGTVSRRPVGHTPIAHASRLWLVIALALLNACQSPAGGRPAGSQDELRQPNPKWAPPRAEPKPAKPGQATRPAEAEPPAHSKTVSNGTGDLSTSTATPADAMTPATTDMNATSEGATRASADRAKLAPARAVVDPPQVDPTAPPRKMMLDGPSLFGPGIITARGKDQPADLASSVIPHNAGPYSLHVRQSDFESIVVVRPRESQAPLVAYHLESRILRLTFSLEQPEIEQVPILVGMLKKLTQELATAFSPSAFVMPMNPGSYPAFVQRLASEAATDRHFNRVSEPDKLDSYVLHKVQEGRFTIELNDTFAEFGLKLHPIQAKECELARPGEPSQAGRWLRREKIHAHRPLPVGCNFTFRLQAPDAATTGRLAPATITAHSRATQTLQSASGKANVTGNPGPQPQPVGQGNPRSDEAPTTRKK